MQEVMTDADRALLKHVREALTAEMFRQGRLIDMDRLAEAAIDAMVKWAMAHPIEVH